MNPQKGAHMISTYTDPRSGRQYTVDDVTGVTAWVTTPTPDVAPGPVPQVPLVESKTARRARRSVEINAHQCGLKIKDGQVSTTFVTRPRSTVTGPLAGARASVSNEAGSRVTATRLLTVGVFALAAKKTTGAVYLTITGADGWEIVSQLDGKHAARAHAFAAQFNSYAASL